MLKLLVLFLCVSLVVSQPIDGDSCTTAQTVTIVQDGTVTVTGDTLNTNLQNSDTTCFRFGYDGIWYKFRNTFDSRITVTSAGSNFDTVLIVLTGTSCADVVCVDSNDDAEGTRQSRVDICTLADRDYFVFIGGWVDEVRGDYTVSFIAASGSPDCSRCANAVTLSLTPESQVSFAATLSINSDAFTDLCPDVAFNGDWYRFRNNFDSSVIVSTDGGITDFDTAINVFSGACGTFDCVTSNDDTAGGVASTVEFCAVVDVDYFIFIGGHFVSALGDYTLTVTAGTITTCFGSGTCDRPLGIDLDNQGTGYHYVGETSIDLPGITACSAVGIGYNGVYYHFKNRYSANVNIDTNGSLFDTFLAVLSGINCATAQCIDANNDADIDSTYSALVICAERNVDYYVFVGGAGQADSGVFSLTLTANEVSECFPSPNSCNSASRIPVLNADITGTTTNIGNYFADCQTHAFNGNWYVFSEDIAYSLTITATGDNFDPALVLLVGGCDGLTCVASTAGYYYYTELNSAVLFSCIVPDTDFYLFVGGTDPTEYGTYTLSISGFQTEFCSIPHSTCNDGQVISLTDTPRSQFSGVLAPLLRNSLFLCTDSAFDGYWYYIYSDSIPQQVTIETIGSLVPTVINVLAGNCDDLGCIASSTSESVNVCLPAFQYYYVFVGGPGNNLQIGEYTVTISSEDTSSCDVGIYCQTPTELQVEDGSQILTGVISSLYNTVVSGCPFRIYNGIWYIFYSGYYPGEYPVTLSTEGSNLDTFLGVYTGTCSSLNCVAYDDDSGLGVTSFLTFCTEASTYYHIYLGGFAVIDQGQYTLSFEPNTAGTCNFQCTGADTVPLSLGTGSYFVSGTTYQFPNTATSCAALSVKNGNWYYIKNCFSSQISISVVGTTIDDTVLVVFSGPRCNSNTCVVENDGVNNAQDSSVQFCAEAQLEYYVLIGGKNPTSVGDYTLLFITTAQDCLSTQGESITNPIPLSELPQDSTLDITGTTSGAINNYSPASCENTGYGGYWYTFTNSYSSEITITTENSVFDTVLVIVAGDCPSTGCVASDDDSIGSQSQVTFCAPANVVFTVFVGGYDTSEFGDYQLHLTTVTSTQCNFPGTTCDSSITISAAPPDAIVVNGITSTLLNNDAPCSLFGGNGLYYQITMNSGDALVAIAITDADYDTVVGVTTGGCAGATCVDYNDDFFGLRSYVNFCGTNGETYYIFIGGFNNNTGSFTASISTSRSKCGTPQASCIGALSVILDADTSYTYRATTTTSLATTVEGCDILAYNGVWYSLSADNSPSHVSISLDNSNGLPTLLVFQGYCGFLECLTTNIDDQGSPQSTVEFCVDYFPGIYIYAGWGDSGTAGFIQLDIQTTGIAQCTPICFDAIDIEPSLLNPVTLTGITSLFGDAINVCDPLVVYNVVWYSISNEYSSQIQLSTQDSDFPTSLAVLSSNGFCDDFGCITSDNANPSQVSFCAQQFANYYVVLGSATADARGSYSLTATSTPATTCVQPGQGCDASIPLSLSSGDNSFTGTAVSSSVNNFSGCFNQIYNGVWYTFTLPTPSGIDFSIDSASFRAYFDILAESCSFSSCILFGFTSSSHSFCAPANVPFFVFIGASDKDDVGDFSFTITVTPQTDGVCSFPAGASCATAVEVVPQEPITTLTYTGITSKFLGNQFLQCETFVFDAYYYHFNLDSAATVAVDSYGSNFDTAIVLLSFSCDDVLGFPYCVASNDDSSDSLQSYVEFCASADVDYYILIGGYADNLVGEFTLHVSFTSNICDSYGGSCSNPNTDFTFFPGSGVVTIYGTTSSLLQNSLDSCAPSYNGLWYEYFQFDNYYVTLSTEGTRFDTLLSVLSGTCDEFYCVASSDDAGIYSFSEVNFCAQPFFSYYIYVAGFSPNDVGNFILTITSELSFGCVADGIYCEGSTELQLFPYDLLQIVGSTSSFIGNSNTICSRTANNGIWYSFSNNFASEIGISTEGSDFDTIIVVVQGPNCNQLECVTSDDDSGASLYSELTFCAKENIQYYVFAGGYGSNFGNYILTFTVSAVDTCSLPGESCASSTSLDLVLGGDITVSGTISSDIANYAPSSCLIPSFDGYWYTFNSPSAVSISYTLNSDFPSAIFQIFTGFCGGLECALINTNGEPLTCYPANLDFYLFVGSSDQLTYGNYQLTLSTTAVASCSYGGITCDSPYAYASPPISVSGYNSVLVGTSLSICQNTVNNGIWYSVDTTQTGILNINTLGSNFDTVLNVFVGSCGSLTCIGSNDDNGFDLTSTIEFCSTSNTYYILVGGYSSTSTGNYNLIVDLTPTLCDVPGVICDTAIQIALPMDDSIQVTGTTISELGNVESCFFYDSYNGYFYKFTNAFESLVTLYTLGSNFDTVLIVFVGNDCNDRQCVAANDDSPLEGGILESFVQFCAKADTTYYIFIGGYTIRVGDYVLAISTDTQAPCNSGTCDEAIQITLPIDDTLSVSGTTFAFGNDLNDNPCTFATNGIWYRFTSTQSLSVDLSTAGSFFPTSLIVVYGPSCSSTDQTCVNDGSTDLSFCAEQNIEYYVFISGDYNFPSSFGDYTLTFTTTSIPSCFGSEVTCELATEIELTPNDAIVITDSTFFIGNYIEACTVPSYNGYWYTFNNAFSSIVTISTFGSDYDTAIVVVGPDCSIYGCVASNDDFDGLSSEVVFCGPSSIDFHVFVGGYSTSDFGNYVLSLRTEVVTSCVLPGISCNNAIAINGIVDNTQLTVNGITSRVLSNSASCPDLGYDAYNGYWYTFTAPSSSEITLSTTNSIFDTVIIVFSSSCSSLSCVEANDDSGFDLTSTLTFCASAGTTYTVFIGGYSEFEYGRYQLSLISIPSPCNVPGNTCLLPTELTILSNQQNVFTGTTTTDIGNSFSGCSGSVPGFNGHWYYFFSVESYDLTISTFGSDFDTVLIVTADSCSADRTCVASSDDYINQSSQVEFCASAFTNYYVFVGGYSPEDTGNLVLTFDASTVVDFCLPQGVVCESAIEVELDYGNRVTLPGDTSLNFGSSVSDCEDPAFNGLYYHFFNVISTQLTISTAGSEFDTTIVVYSGPNCDTLSCEVSNDDADVLHQTSEVSFCAQQGIDYLVYIGGHTIQDVGDYVISFTSTPIDTSCVSEGLACDNSTILSFTASSGVVTVSGTTYDFLLNYFTACEIPVYLGYWYSFNNDFASQIVISTAGSDFDTAIAVIAGTCTNFGCAGSNDDFDFTLQSSVSICAPPGIGFSVFVGGWSEGVTGNYQLSFSITPTTACVFPGATCTNPVAISLPTAGTSTTYNGITTRLLNNVVADCDVTGVDGYWYRFTATATASQVTVSTLGSEFDTVLVAYLGTCGNLACLTSNDDFVTLTSQIDFCAFAGDNVLIFVGGFPGTNSVGAYNFTISTSTTPACVFPNSVCDNALPVTLSSGGTTLPYTGYTILDIANSVNNCEFPVFNGYWYSFTNTFYSQVFATTSGSTFDTALAAFSGSCSSLNCIASNDDFDGVASEISFCAVQDDPYFIFVGGYADDVSGSYVLTFNTISRFNCNLDGVVCLDAAIINFLDADDTITITSYSSLALRTTLSTCADDTVYNGIWYRFRNSFASEITISSRGSSFDTVLAVLSGTCAQSACVVSNDDTDDSTSEVTFCAVADSGYFVVIGGFDNTDAGRFILTLTSTSTSPDCCVSSCFGRECGSDGCTGSCGTCNSESTCIDFACVPNPSLSRTPTPSPSGPPRSVSPTKSVPPTPSSTNTATFIRGSASNSPTRSITHSRTTSKSIDASSSPSPVPEPSDSASPSRIVRPSESPLPPSESRSPTPSTSFLNATRSPAPGDSTNFELAIVLSSNDTQSKSAFSTQSSIEDLISSELNQGAQVTVTAINGDNVIVLICNSSEQDLDNLLKAFDDGTFRGTVLDGAQVDSVKVDADCENVSSVDLYSSSSNIDTITVVPSSASTLVLSFISLLALLIVSLL